MIVDGNLYLYKKYKMYHILQNMTDNNVIVIKDIIDNYNIMYILLHLNYMVEKQRFDKIKQNYNNIKNKK